MGFLIVGLVCLAVLGGGILFAAVLLLRTACGITGVEEGLDR